MTMNIKEVTLRTPTGPELTVGRLYTNSVDCINYLLGSMPPDMLVQRTAAFAYFTEVDGVFYAAETGDALLRAIIEEDELIQSQLQLPKPLCDWLYTIWSRNIDHYVTNGDINFIQEFIETPYTENIISWQTACKYFDDNYNKGLIWTYLLDNLYVPGDYLDILREDEVEEMEDRASAWESDRYLALTRLTKHYFTVGMMMDGHNLDVRKVASAFAAFMDKYDSLRDV